MHHFEYREDELYCEGVSLARLAGEVGTPLYVYSHATLSRHYQAFDRAFAGLDHLTAYSVKANSNLAILALLAGMGGGADIVSGGELFRALAAGVPANRIVFSGVGKTAAEMREAIEADILMFNVESSQELDLLGRITADLGQRARVALRVNPDVDPKTHPYISTGLKKNKFGVPIERARDEYLRAAAMPGLEVVGMACHIGSQLIEVAPFVDAVGRLLVLVDHLRADGLNLKYLDVGGGLGITYQTEEPPDPREYGEAIRQALTGVDLRVILEPGRVIVGNAGVLLVQVQYTKKGDKKTFVVTDGGMNDLIRPALYDAYHGVRPVQVRNRDSLKVDVVGPICESSDFLAKDRVIPAVLPGEFLAIMSAGAYGFSMTSNYNSRRRPAEVLVQGDRYQVIRRRDTYEDLVRGEEIPSFLAKGAQ